MWDRLGEDHPSKGSKASAHLQKNARETEIDPDAELMLRVRDSGDLEAFEELVQRYQDRVLNTVVKMLGDTTDSEDIAQLVFIRIWKSANRYQPQAKFSTWLFTITRNLVLNEVRRRKRHPASSLDAPSSAQKARASSLSAFALRSRLHDSGAPSPEEGVIHEELRQAVDEAIASLPENQRLAILLWRFEEMSYEEIGAVLKQSLSAVKSLIFRARANLKEKLRDHLGR